MMSRETYLKRRRKSLDEEYKPVYDMLMATANDFLRFDHPQVELARRELLEWYMKKTYLPDS